MKTSHIAIVAIALCTIAAAGSTMEPEEVADRQSDNNKPADDLARFFDARKLVASGDFAGATAEYLSIWRSTREPEALRRVPFYADRGDLRSLLSKHEPARASFTRLRDELTAIVEKDDRCTRYQLADWFFLNHLLDDDARTLAWFDRVKSPEIWKRWQSHGWAKQFMLELLEEQKRWSDMCLAAPDPLETLQALRRIHSDFDRAPGNDVNAERHVLEKSTGDNLRQNAPGFYVGYLKAGDKHKAVQYAEEVGRWPDTSDVLIEMVRLAIHEDVPQDSQLKLLQDAEAKGQNVNELRTLLKKALAEKK